MASTTQLPPLSRGAVHSGLSSSARGSTRAGTAGTSSAGGGARVTGGGINAKASRRTSTLGRSNGGGMRGSPRKTGMLRTVDVADGGPGAAVLEPSVARASLRQRVCLDMLVQGQVEAFIELFDLTQADHDKTNLAKDKDAMRTLKRNLAVAEVALRDGDYATAYAARRRQAEDFASKGQTRNAALQREAALEVASGANEPALVADALLSRGLLQEKSGDHAGARASFEACHALATEHALEGGLAPAIIGAHLAGACYAQAAEIEAETGDTHAAFDIFTHAIKLAESVNYVDLIRRLHYRLGRLCEAHGEAEAGVAHLEAYVSGKGHLEDEETGQAQACLGLARCYDRLGDLDTAVKYLEKMAGMIKTMPKPSTDLVIEMCERLGALLRRQDKHEQATQWFERAYDAAKSTDGGNDVSAMRRLQALVGISRASLLGNRFLGLVQSNTTASVGALLRWGGSHAAADLNAMRMVKPAAAESVPLTAAAPPTSQPPTSQTARSPAYVVSVDE